MKGGDTRTDGTDVVFEPATHDDVPRLAAIDATSPRPWTEAAFRSELEHDPKTLFVLRVKGETAAFLVLRMQGSEVDILNVAVADSQRRLGFGTLTMKRALAYLAARRVSSVFLEVRASNRAACDLYAGLGFKETQKRRDFYENPREDAILMRLQLTREEEG